MTQTEREFDVIILGATGFTGRLVAEHLLSTYGVDGPLRWAIAGRSEEKLTAIRDQLGKKARKLAILVADSHDPQSLRELAVRTKVIATTVGPYALHGSDLVAACARNGTHYCDLAGEVPWMRRMIDAHHATAKRSGALIVHCCGFDSIPSDLGVWFMQKEAQARFGQPLQRVHYYLKAASGGLSGGTAASMMEVAGEAQRDRRVLKLLADPYALNPRASRRGDDRADALGISKDELLDAWVAPFLMAGINTRVVRRTNALLGNAYGDDFRYAEFTAAGSGLVGLAKAAAISGGMGALMVGAALPPTRALLRRFVFPQQGDGPNAEERKRGFFKIELAGIDSEGRILRGTATGKRDPGYGCTSRMLGESAVCLANLATRHPDDPGGFSTPAAAMGDALVERLARNADVSFQITGTEDLALD
ncbi:MAG: saccharopine dehydrogenase NADP-binding domain-containing protein [Pseudomonadota bacterium]